MTNKSYITSEDDLQQRNFLIGLRSAAWHMADTPGLNPSWARVYLRLADAANQLDAYLARCEDCAEERVPENVAIREALAAYRRWDEHTPVCHECGTAGEQSEELHHENCSVFKAAKIAKRCLRRGEDGEE